MSTPWYASAELKGLTWFGEPDGAVAVDERRRAEMLAGAAGAQVLGRGYDSFTSELRGYALKDTEIIEEVPQGGQLKTYSMRSITSARELRESMGVAAAAAFSFLNVGVSTKAEWARSRDVSAHSVYLLIRVTVENVKQTLRRFELGDDARALVAERPFDPKAFHRRCGDRFVSEHLTGGEFFALYEFRTRSSEERNRVKVEVAAAGGTWDASGGFEHAMKNLQVDTESTVRGYINGGKGHLPEFEPAKLLEFAREFPEAVDKAPVLYDTGTTDYYVAQGFPGDVDLPYPSNRRAFVDLALVRDRVRMYESAVDYVRRNPEQFKDADQWDPAAVVRDLRRLGERIEGAATELVEAPFVEHRSPLAQLRDEADEVERKLPEELADVMTRDSGEFVGHQSHAGWNLHQGQGGRRFSISIKFKKRFYKEPEVRLALTGFDILQGTNHRLRVLPEKVTRDGFDAVILTWADTRVWSATGVWTAEV